MSLNPVLYLPLWKRDGSQFISEDAYGHLCTVTGATWGSQGRTFNGTQYISMPVSASLDLTGDMTLNVWVYVTSAPELANLVGNSDSNICGYRLAFAANMTTLYYETNKAAVNQLTQGSTSSLLNRWAMITATRSGAVAKLYDNAVDKTSSSASHINPVTSPTPVRLGVFATGPTTQFLRGTMGEVQIYNRVLSALEIQQHYLATKWRYQ